MRFFRRGDMDDEAAQPPVPRVERLRELVDELPPLERHCVERIIFGQATKLVVAHEAGVSPKAVREAYEQGLARLGQMLESDPEMGSLLPTLLASFRTVPEPPVLAGEGDDTGPLLRGETGEGPDPADVGLHV